ncbi:MAG: hypothetical protein Q9163_004166 [Psora crenata]
MRSRIIGTLVIGALSVNVLANDVLKTSGFTTCVDNSKIVVKKLDIQFDRRTNQLSFDVAGTSSEEQSVMARLSVSAYGKEVYSNGFNPCDEASKHAVPAGSFAAKGTMSIPAEYSDKIPSIAFTVPDLEGQAKLELNPVDGGQPLACIQSEVNNGKTMEVSAVSYVAVGIAGCALILSGFASLGNAGTAGSHAPSPSFGTVVTWFQGVAMNGMMSVDYPPVYQSYTKNFAFAGGLISWDAMQTSIDNFRKVTGGNLTENSVIYLKNATLLHSSGSKQETSIARKRSWGPGRYALEPALLTREFTADVNGSQVGNGTYAAGNETSKVTHLVHGIQGYVEQLTIPQANTFMTVLLIFAIVIAAIAVAILLLKVVLEIWALFASFPKKLTGFRKRYWGLLGRTITNLILLLYGIWTLYCVFQFTNGDSWAAKVLAAVTFAAFTVLLAFFTFRIWQLAQRFKRLEGDTSALFEDKETWRKYSLFYDNYKRGYWWLFMPAIIYMFAKGCVIAGGNGHGLTQSAGQLIVESLMLVLVLWCRPFVSTSGNIINIFIQVVRVLSVVCILVFVEELGISQSTKTITGVVLIAVQSVLTAILAILIAVNAIILCVRENPHRRQRKEAEKLNRDLDNLTPLSPRNSLLMDPYPSDDLNKAPLEYIYHRDRRSSETLRPYIEEHLTANRTMKKAGARESSENLVGAAVPMGTGHCHERTLMDSSDSTNDCVERYVKDIFACYSELSALPCLDPSPEVHETFERLVSLCSQVPNAKISQKVLQDDRIVQIAPRLRELCSEGEFQLEAHWAEIVSGCKSLQKGTFA